jgi:tetratricopeptide (TPR) repeat protein
MGILTGIFIGILISLPIDFMLAGHRRTAEEAGSFDVYKDLSKKGKIDFLYYAIGKRMYQEGDREKGIEYLNKAVKLNPDETLYLEEHIDIAKFLNFDDELRTDLEKLIESDPDNIQATYDLAFLYSDEGMERKAVEITTRLLDKLPVLSKDQPSDGREKLYFGRGGAYFYLGEYDKSFKDLHQAIELNPSFLPMTGDLMTFNERLGRMKEARTAAMVILSKFPKPESTTDYQHYGAAYRVLGNYQKSIEFFDKSFEVNPNNLIVIYERAMSHIKNNDLESARRDLKKVIELNSPDKAEAEEILKKIGDK